MKQRKINVIVLLIIFSLFKYKLSRKNIRFQIYIRLTLPNRFAEPHFLVSFSYRVNLENGARTFIFTTGFLQIWIVGFVKPIPPQISVQVSRITVYEINGYDISMDSKVLSNLGFFVVVKRTLKRITNCTKMILKSSLIRN